VTLLFPSGGGSSDLPSGRGLPSGNPVPPGQGQGQVTSSEVADWSDSVGPDDPRLDTEDLDSMMETEAEVSGPVDVVVGVVHDTLSDVGSGDESRRSSRFESTRTDLVGYGLPGPERENETEDKEGFTTSLSKKAKKSSSTATSTQVHPDSQVR